MCEGLLSTPPTDTCIYSFGLCPHIYIHEHALTRTRIYIYIIYIYSHPQTDLFRSIRTLQCGKTVSSPRWGRNPVNSDAKSKFLTIQPRGHISCEVNFKTVINHNYYCLHTSIQRLYIYHIYQPLRSGRIWHKVNGFKRSLTGLNSEFSFS